MTATHRFSNRVDNYARYRPGYPPAVINLLQQQCHLNPQSVIADLGSGTGIFTRLLLNAGYTVYAVEPNDAMRNASVIDLGRSPKFHPVNGRAKATGLPAKTADLVVCAQAFHWFDAEKAKVEFKRILKPGGMVALIWNNRDIEADAFSIAYELLLQQEGTDYKKVNHQNLTEADFASFFKNGQYQLTKFANVQVFDEAGLIGRALSSSYVPTEDTTEGRHFVTQLKGLFNQHQTNGKVNIYYQTEVYIGQV